jgi:hypothetical protein
LQVTYDLEATPLGMNPGEFIIYSARHSGKSTYFMANSIVGFKKLTESQVDGTTWHTVGCSKEAAAWVKEQPQEFWYEHIDENWYISLNRFDVHEKLYLLLGLKWA